MQIDSVLQALPRRIKEILPKESLEELQEIRLRCGQPFALKRTEGLFFLREDGVLIKDPENGILISAAEIRETVSLLSAYSLYAFEEELRQGFLTVAGGHRVGFCGKTVLEHGEIKTLRQINALNIRIAREIKGAGKTVLPFLMEEEVFCHTLIVSPPGCGKTTLLRDIIRYLSTGETGRFFTVGVVDERGEIAPCKDGVPQMDVGICTDVLEGCPKAKGMCLLLRSMSPDVIAVDELGRAEDVRAVEEVLHAGVKLIATVHGRCLQDLQMHPHLCELMEKQFFERYLFLSRKNGIGTVEEILGRNGNILWKGEVQ